MKARKKRKPKPHRQWSKVPREPDKQTKKKVKRVLACSRLIAAAWALELGLDPEHYSIRFSPDDWSYLALLPHDVRRTQADTPHITLDEAVDIAERILPVFIASKTLAGEPIVKSELGLPEAWE